MSVRSDGESVNHDSVDPCPGRPRDADVDSGGRNAEPGGAGRNGGSNCGRVGCRDRHRDAGPAFVDLLQTITGGTLAYPHRYGQDFWTDLDTNPTLRRTFDAQMNWRIQFQADQIAERVDWSRFPKIVDVGGGDGTVLTAILQAHPHGHGQVMDLPPTAMAAISRFDAAGLSDRAGAAAGSFFDPLPAGADAYLLSDVLHDWDDEHVRTILDGCRVAATPNATVVVIESMRGLGGSTGFDLFMLMCFGGRQRSSYELAELAAGCGLALQSSRPVTDERTALEFTVARP